MDIGNACISFSCVEDGACLHRFTISSDKNRTAEEYAVLLSLIASGSGASLSDAAGAIIASVVPQLTGVLASAVERCTACRPLIVGPGVRSGLNIRMDAPTELGGDLVAAAVAAAYRYPLPCILINMGTATAVGVLDKSGSYIGGLICPGVGLSQSSLARSASQLPDVSLAPPRRVIGKNTRDSMQSGIILGAASMIDGIVDRIETELGTGAASVIATGENAAVILPYCRRTDVLLDEDLVMRGLWHIWRRNRDST